MMYEFQIAVNLYVCQNHRHSARCGAVCERPDGHNNFTEVGGNIRVRAVTRIELLEDYCVFMRGSVTLGALNSWLCTDMKRVRISIGPNLMGRMKK